MVDVPYNQTKPKLRDWWFNVIPRIVLVGVGSYSSAEILYGPSRQCGYHLENYMLRNDCSRLHAWQQHPTRHQLYGSPHMAAQKQDDQHEHTFSSYVRIQDVVLKTYLGRWTIGRSGERGSGISVLPARYDDDEGMMGLVST